MNYVHLAPDLPQKELAADAALSLIKSRWHLINNIKMTLLSVRNISDDTRRMA